MSNKIIFELARTCAEMDFRLDQLCDDCRKAEESGMHDLARSYRARRHVNVNKLDPEEAERYALNAFPNDDMIRYAAIVEALWLYGYKIAPQLDSL